MNHLFAQRCAPDAQSAFTVTCTGIEDVEHAAAAKACRPCCRDSKRTGGATRARHLQDLAARISDHDLAAGTTAAAIRVFHFQRWSRRGGIAVGHPDKTGNPGSQSQVERCPDRKLTARRIGRPH